MFSKTYKESIIILKNADCLKENIFFAKYELFK